MAKAITENTLFYGDNLDILRDYLIDECVDLIYLDPPFNSSRNYNVLFKDEQGLDSEAQIVAFEDTWHWTVQQNMLTIILLPMDQIKLRALSRHLEALSGPTK